MNELISPQIPLHVLRERYEALPEFPDFPGERTWVDRLGSWDSFLVFGPITAEHFHDMPKRSREEFSALFPELIELVFEAWPEESNQAD